MFSTNHERLAAGTIILRQASDALKSLTWKLWWEWARAEAWSAIATHYAAEAATTINGDENAQAHR